MLKMRQAVHSVCLFSRGRFLLSSRERLTEQEFYQIGHNNKDTQKSTGRKEDSHVHRERSGQPGAWGSPG